MQYQKNQRNNDELSRLGFGCMRFPAKGAGVDEEYAIDLIRKAVAAGINYFDTAYIYHGGASESILGKALSDGSREKVKIATKLPHYLARRNSDLDRIFATQLKRLQTSYVDYYLIHMLGDVGIWQRLCDIGIKEWITKKKKQGIIRNIGFSFHGTPTNFIALLDIYDWDFTQIQYNYLDTDSQAGKSGLDYAHKKGLPVIVMEPLRGGKLVTNLSKDVTELLKEKNISPAELGLAWVFDQAEVTVVLSGMSDYRQLEDNVRYVDLYKPQSLSKDTLRLVEDVKALIMRDIKVPCTACAYCLPCPQGVDIPGCFAAYNDKYCMKTRMAWVYYLQNTGAASDQAGNAGKCINCGACRSRCPQNIDIPEELKNVRKDMEHLLFKIGAWGMRLVMGNRRKAKSE